MEPAILTCPVCSSPADVEVPLPAKARDADVSDRVEFECATCGAAVSVTHVTSETVAMHSIV